MSAIVQGVVELLKLGGAYAALVIAMGWAIYERWQNQKNSVSMVQLATAQIGALTKLEGMITAQEKLLTMALSRRGGK